MKPYYETKLGKLYHGDCLEIMPKLEPVDLVLTDPPYAKTTHGNIRTNKGAGNAQRAMTKTGKFNLGFNSFEQKKFFKMCEVCIDVAQGWVVMTCDHKHAPVMFGSDCFIRLGAWVKTNPMPQISADRPGQGHEAVLILHSGKIKKRWNRGGGSAVWHGNVCSKALIPTQKPIWLYMSFLSDFSTQEGIVLDPHFGSGTTGVACERLNKKWVGIEQLEKHCEIAAKRLEQETAQLKLFN